MSVLSLAPDAPVLSDIDARLCAHLLLLAGIGGDESPIQGGWPDIAGGRPTRLERSCVDAGSRLLVSVSAPQWRHLGLYQRVAEGGRPQVSRWSWWKGAAASTERDWGWRHVFIGEPPGVWDEVSLAVRGYAWDVARTGGSEAALDVVSRWHATLGPAGRIYSLSVPETGSPWVAWHLDKRLPIDRALHACGVDGSGGLAIIADLLGSDPSATGGPWSVAVASDGSRWRLGTSRWAHNREDAGKHRRLASVVQNLGGDGRFAEAAYKLVIAAGEDALPARVGRAVEVEFAAGSGIPAGAEFFLSVPGAVGRREPDRPPAVTRRVEL
jgi:hypothetical protein